MSKRTLFIALTFTAAVAALASVRLRALRQQPASPPADLVLTNGKVVTVEDGMPEAQAIAVTGDRIAAIGSSADIKRHVGPKTQVIDLKGQLVIPGFIEGHGHFTGVGQAQLNLNLMKTTSWDQIVAMVGDAAKKAKPGQWIYGRGWHQEKWTTKPDTERRRLSDARRVEQGVARQSRPADPRQRPCELRECESDGALRHHQRDAQPNRW